MNNAPLCYKWTVVCEVCYCGGGGSVAVDPEGVDEFVDEFVDEDVVVGNSIFQHLPVSS